MTDRTQFEAMLEALINEDQETAKEIFHQIVVAKSREIYEELLAEDFEEEEVEEGAEEEEESTSEGAEEEGEEEASDDEEAADDEEGDASDDFAGDDEEGEESPFGDEEGGEGELEDRVMDLEDALDELKAEFEELMAGEEAEGHHDDMGGDLGDLGGDLDGGLEMEDPMADPAMMEYVNKVSLPKHGDNGANAKSIVAKPNNMGGTSKNIAQSFSTEKGGTQGGLLKPSTTLQDGGNMNKPGANAGKTAFKKKETAKMGDAGDKSAGSMINGAPKRAK